MSCRGYKVGGASKAAERYFEYIGDDSMWYAMQTETGREEVIKRQAEKMIARDAYRDCKVLYCIRKKRYMGEWHEERERLLPGYIFLVTDEPEPASKSIQNMTEFIKLLGYGGKIYPIAKAEEELLSKLTREKNEIGMSYGVIENGILKIKDGVLVGMESSVRKIDRHKRKGYIRLSMPDGAEKLVGVGLEITEKTNVRN